MADAIPPTSPTPVSARPPDNLGGATISVGGSPGDLQTAINASAQGDTLVCPAGVTYPPITLPIRTGAGWTCIRVANDVANLPVNARVPASGANMFKAAAASAAGAGPALGIPAGTQGWRFIGMEVTQPNDNFQFSLVNNDGYRTSFERCYSHGTPGGMLRRAFFIRGHDCQVWDSYISECKELGQDTQTIFTRDNQRLHVENCELQATGENILLGDVGSASATTDVTLKRNHFFKPLTWRRLQANGTPNPSWDGFNWVVKNLFETKWGKRILVEGNTLENNWASQGQDGTAIVLVAGRTPSGVLQDTSDVRFQHNTVKHAEFMFSVQTFENVLAPVIARIALLNNLGLQIHGRMALINWRSDDLWIEHNTVVPCNPAELQASIGQNQAAIMWSTPSPWNRLTIRRNVFGKVTYGLYMDGSPAFLSTADADLYIPNRSFAENAVHSGSLDEACAGFTSYPGTTAKINLTTGELASDSPLKITNGGGGSDGKDLGVDFQALDAAQQGTAPPPVPAPSTLESRVTALEAGLAAGIVVDQDLVARIAQLEQFAGTMVIDSLPTLTARVAALEAWRAKVKEVA